MSIADRQGPMGVSANWLRTRSGHYALVPWAVLIMLLDVARIFLLPQSYQSAFTDIFEVAVVGFGAIACAFAAARSSGITRGLWAMTAAFFGLCAAGDLHDFLLDIDLGGHLWLGFLEVLGWCTYLPLAWLIFFPAYEDSHAKSRWLPVIDLSQVALAIALIYFRFIYLHHLNMGRGWTSPGRPEMVRNILLSVGLLLRARVEPTERARAVYRIVGAGVASFVLGILLFKPYGDEIPQTIRPAALMAIGLCAAYWQDPPANSERAGRRQNRLQSVLTMFGGATLFVVLVLASNTPASYRPFMYAIAAVSASLFILRSWLAEHSLRLFRTLLDQSNDAIKVIDPETQRLLDVNERACVELGYSREELLAMTAYDIAPGFNESIRDDLLRQLKETGSAVFERMHRRKDGGTFPVEVTLRMAQADRTYEIAISRNITARKQTEAALREKEDRYQDLVEHSEDLVCTHDLRGNLLSVNPMPARLLGYEVDELLKIPMREFVAPVFREHFDAYLERIGTLGADRGVLCVLARNGERRIWEYNNTLRTEGVSQPVVRGMAHDVTDRKKAEAALRGSEQRYRLLFEKTVAGVAIARIDGRIVDCNDAWAKMFGYTQASECRGEQIASRYANPAHRQILLDHLQKTGVFLNREFEFRRRDGTQLWVLLNCVLITEGGEPVIQSTMLDITARKHAEDALRRSEENYRNFVAQSSEGIFRQDVDAPIPIDLPEDELVHHILHDSYLAECNDAIATMYGLTVQDFLGKRLTDTVDPSDPRNIELTREYIRSGFRVLERESHETDIHGTPKIFKNSMIGIVEDGKLVRTWGIQRDVTEQVSLEEARKKAEEALRESERRLQLALQVGKIGAFDVDLGTGRGKWSSEVEEIWEIPKGFSGDFAQFCREHVHPDDLDRIKREFGDLVHSNNPQEMEFRVIGSGGAVRWIRWRGLVAKDAAGSLRVAGVNMDITQRKHAEDALRKSEERFRVALKGSPITVFNQDRELRYTWINNPQLHWQQDAIGKTDDEILGPKKAALFNELKARVLQTGVPLREEVVITQEGNRHAFDMTIEPLFDADHGVVGITAACMDIARLRAMADRLQQAQERLSEEKKYLENEIQKELGFEEIVGQSPALREVLKKARIVAPTDSSVLLLGETGTGKELVARSVHSLSGRRDKTFVKLNCAAVPSGLLESELFGHEKGAFTGAVSQKLGRIELADKGTLFLDEIGELPLELQPKLLRVLQDREFERLGGVRTLRVDVRIISATNRDLRQHIADKKFREDLFYRLNVFPIDLPPLRDRREDIPMLIHHFVKKHSMHMGKQVEVIPDETMQALRQWTWPGNVRELENMIERMVIMSKGRVLAAPPAELGDAESVAEDDLTEMEREHIIRVLRETNGVLSGMDGAATRLGVKRTTLQSMIKRLGIEAHEYRRGSGTGTFGRE